MLEKQYGTVVWFNEKKGWGFCKPDEGDIDLFVHWTNIVGEEGQFKTLVSGQRVSFVVGANKNGPQAEQIEIIEEE